MKNWFTEQQQFEMELIGWVGTTLVIIAYYPQIQHLWVEKCAWGISLWMWFIWLVSSALLLIYAWLRGETLFITVQTINILAVAATILLTRRSNQICPYHKTVAAKPSVNDS